MNNEYAWRKTGVDAWLGKVLGTDIQPYDAFISFLREKGDERGVWMVGRAKENQITESMRPRVRKREGSDAASGPPVSPRRAIRMLAHYVWRLILRFTVQYGYNPFLALVYLIVLSLCGWLVFSLASGETVLFGMLGNKEWHFMFPTKATYYEGGSHEMGEPYEGCKDKGKPCIGPAKYPKFNPFVYSLELATPTPGLGQEENWGGVEGENLFILYKWFHMVIGWSLSLLLVLSPTKLLRRD